MEPQVLQSAERLLACEPELRPTPADDALAGILPAVLDDLTSGRTVYPAEAVSRYLAYGGLMLYSGVVVLGKGGLAQAGRPYRQWIDGLVLPMLLLDQAFAVLSLGLESVLDSIEGLVGSPQFDPKTPPRMWGYRLLAASVAEASARLRADSSGADALEWFLSDGVGSCEEHRAAGLVASVGLYQAYLAEVAGQGFAAGGAMGEG